MNVIKRPTRLVLVLALVLLIALPIAVPDSQYEQSVLLWCFLFAIMASGWNLISGLAGYVSLGHSVYLGIGMYTGAILAKTGTSRPST